MDTWMKDGLEEEEEEEPESEDVKGTMSRLEEEIRLHTKMNKRLFTVCHRKRLWLCDHLFKSWREARRS